MWVAIYSTTLLIRAEAMSPPDDYAEFLRHEARSSISVWHQFRLDYRAEQRAVYAFFEGYEDKRYFVPDIRRALRQEREVHVYVCSGKRGVVEVRERIKGDTGVDSCLFFIDRDFDDILDQQVTIDDYTYITDGYSIENDIVTVEAIEVVFADILGLSKNDIIYSNARSNFLSGYEAFKKKLRPFIYGTLAFLAEGKKVNLNNIDLGKTFLLDNNGFSEKRSDGLLQYRKAAGLNSEKCVLSSVRVMRTKIGEAADSKWVRGKFALWYLENFLKHEIATVKTATGKGGRKLKIPPALLGSNLFELLPPSLRKPASLQTFLEERLSTQT
jgi:hypothetical protein